MTRGNGMPNPNESWRFLMSPGFMPDAAIRMRTSPAPGRGSGISPTISTSLAGPCFSYHAALIGKPHFYFSFSRSWTFAARGQVRSNEISTMACGGSKMISVPASGIEPGQRRLNGPQTTGREYRNLSQPTHLMSQDDDVGVPMRDGINLLADVHRPAEPGRYPVLVAASPYPRQIQNFGAPAGFIEAGASDFFVPRGYVHVI